MSIWRIEGGRPLCGSVRAQGSKNAVLPMLAACVACGCEAELMNCPELSDVTAASDILEHLGCSVSRDGDIINVDSRGVNRYDIPDRLMREMRSSVLFLGAILARTGQAVLSAPGGCRLGERPIDLHLSALRALGARIDEQGGRLDCHAEGLRGALIDLSFPSVGATENAMIAACAAEGTTVIENAAREPEICDLQNFLSGMGAEISGAGTRKITISGFRPSGRVGHRVMPDRIVTATVLCAAAASAGAVEVRGARPEQLCPVLDALEQSGCELGVGKSSISLRAPERPLAGGTIVTRPYPGFPTDVQPLFMASCLKAKGSTVFVENIFENRYRHIEEFCRLGAKIQTEGRVALVTGVERLRGADMRARDLRGGAALMIAAMSAEGSSTVVDDGEFIARGYEHIDELFSALGAKIQLVT